ncbi:phosphoribosylformylglycinamidine cyclo-ligase [Planomicrobium sp. CPCC 101110]|uniref:phosphoribosylformylglycinamidine cyclo-ligase n=1 Tax=Planomicrobium sp. CPCC 101110 TaxID=2599619 RepID=UPI0011B7C899|nr:phosphoribosylformylglycinamidine cyclo-ligase [Planomicrobium sp. CPCC 101110]TWT24064.1 phosphoribosylformylglycinamidine cyclo-ligase [Planomicrobium sp. CPCC 101110]
MSKAYEKAGVNIEAGYEAVNRMKSHVERTARKGLMGAFGGFGGMFDLSALDLKEPVLVSGTDGVGTKLKLAFMADKHDSIGIDCVAMCVNDIVAQGAEPLFFLDYIAVGKAVPEKIEQIVKGVADGCVEAGAALIGGETAEMPGLYEEDEYDIAGFAVGAAEKSKIVTGENIQAGDVLIGLASSGIHSNGYSLVRQIVFEDNNFTLNQAVEGYEALGALGDVLLTPTKIYAKAVAAVSKDIHVHGMAHVTGGGFIENIPRMMPAGLGAEIQLGSWPVLDVFNLLKEKGNLADRDLYSVFNMGIGFVLAVAPEDADRVLDAVTSNGEQAFIIGRVSEAAGVQFSGEQDGSLHGN